MVTTVDTDTPSAPQTRPSWRRYSAVAVWTAAVGLAAFTLWRLFGAEIAWPFLVVMAYTPYAVLVAVVALAAAVALKNLKQVAVVAASLAVLVTVLAPRAFADRPPAVDGPPLTVMSVNLHVGRADPARIVDLVTEHDVDLLSVQELTGDAAYGLATAGIDEILPEQHLVPIDGGAAGSGLYSRYPLQRRGELDGVFSMPTAAVDVPGAGAVETAVIHIASPHSPGLVAAWREELSAVPWPDGEETRVLAGDFNATLDHAAMRDILDRGYVDAAEQTGDGLTTTWHPGPPSPPVTLDHVLTAGAAVESVSVVPIPDSDHHPVIAVLRLPAAD